MIVGLCIRVAIRWVLRYGERCTYQGRTFRQPVGIRMALSANGDSVGATCAFTCSMGRPTFERKRADDVRHGLDHLEVGLDARFERPVDRLGELGLLDGGQRGRFVVYEGRDDVDC